MNFLATFNKAIVNIEALKMGCYVTRRHIFLRYLDRIILKAGSGPSILIKFDLD
jgi:hypothetical protein